MSSNDKNIAKQRDDHMLVEKGLYAATGVTAPTKAGTPTYSSDIDLGFALPNVKDARLADIGVLVSAPAHAVASLPNAKTYLVSVCGGTAASPTAIILGDVITQLGAGGVGCVAAEVTVKLPTNCPRYIRAKVVCSTTTLTTNAGTFDISLVF